MRILLGTILVLIVVAAGCQPSMLDQCREAVKLAEMNYLKDPDLCRKGFPEWPSYCDNEVLECLSGGPL
jgi:hypothetical protein